MSSPSAKLTEQLRKGGWLPANREAVDKWLTGKRTQAQRSRALLRPPVQELKDLIENDSDLYMGFNRMLKDVTTVQDYNELLSMLNQILGEAPLYGDIAPPFYMIVYGAMNTNAGLTTFLADKLNAQLKKIFDAWGQYLLSPASASVLTTDEAGGWLSSDAVSALEAGYDGKSFAELFVCDMDQPHWGYTSWDDFFTRALNPGIRSLELPESPAVINAACESACYKVANDVKERDEFWLKGEPYSLRHMLNNDDEYTSLFIGGTIFQGFLSVTGYHRWHSPVTGTIKKIVSVPGKCFVQSPALLGTPSDDHPYLQSQSFITSVATRMLIFIESSNPTIGLMCFIAVGMLEVSTCEATVQVGQQVQRGDQLGMFHFGGSSHCLVFRKEAGVQFDGDVTEPGSLVRVRSAIGAAQV